MKNILLAVFFAGALSAAQAQHSLQKLWASDTILPQPESVLYDAQGKILYTSLIDGDGSAKDGKGGVAKLSLDGKIINKNWVTGLNAPKGLGKFGNTLYAADVDEVVVIDIPAARVIKKIAIRGAKFLNDITVDSKGVVYVSDTQTGDIFKIDNGNVTTFLKNIKGANGVLALGTNLYALSSGTVIKADAQGNTKSIATGLDNSTDGIEQVTKGEFVVSCWNGVIYYVKEDGSTELLLDTRAEKMNTADIGYDPVNRIVYVPTFFKNNVVAYKLK
ncbi:MAG TPA: hypothetical protein VHB48_10780 [Chitinophagaceae bacterium]|nr:hypothetical protein [Chitinophagaceae bacterium]